jgi:hypothetical protein
MCIVSWHYAHEKLNKLLFPIEPWGVLLLENRGPKLWLIGLIILLSICLPFLGIALGFWLVTANVAVLTSIIVGLSVGLSVLFVCYGAYQTYKKKQSRDLLLSLTIAGVVFIMLGAIVFVPYTTSRTYETVSSFDITYWIQDRQNLENIVSPNGTLIEQTLPSSGSRTYFIEDGPFWSNSTVYQIEFSYQGKINFVMTDSYYGLSGPVLNMTYEGFGSYTLWSTLLWTPPYEGRQTLTFVFMNLENLSKTFYFTMTQFNREDSISPSVTNYQTVVNPSLAYAGLCMICVAAVISAGFLRRLRTKEESNGSNIKVQPLACGKT